MNIKKLRQNGIAKHTFIYKQYSNTGIQGNAKILAQF